MNLDSKYVYYLFFLLDHLYLCIMLLCRYPSSSELEIAILANQDNSSVTSSSNSIVAPLVVSRSKKNKREYGNISDSGKPTVTRRIPLPRIPKCDIRRNYGVMFTNVFNSHDMDYLKKFLDSFVSPFYSYTLAKSEGSFSIFYISFFFEVICLCMNCLLRRMSS
jgi:hypothetical protein